MVEQHHLPEQSAQRLAQGLLQRRPRHILAHHHGKVTTDRREARDLADPRHRTRDQRLQVELEGDLIDVQEFAIMCLAGFPEPRTFARRVARVLAERQGEFDIAHDNQVLGHGMLDIEDAAGIPMITTIHHPITFDRRIDLAQTRNPWRKLTLRRWYGFLRMQAAVARQVRWILTPSEASKRDIARDFGVDPSRMQVILLGVDDNFVPPTKPRVPGRIMAMASADAPMKGIATLLEAFAKLRTERDVELVLVTRPAPGGRTEKLIDKLGISGAVRFASGLSDDELVELLGGKTADGMALIVVVSQQGVTARQLDLR